MRKTSKVLGLGLLLLLVSLSGVRIHVAGELVDYLRGLSTFVLLLGILPHALATGRFRRVGLLWFFDDLGQLLVKAGDLLGGSLLVVLDQNLSDVGLYLLSQDVLDGLVEAVLLAELSGQKLGLVFLASVHDDVVGRQITTQIDCDPDDLTGCREIRLDVWNCDG